MLGNSGLRCLFIYYDTQNCNLSSKRGAGNIRNSPYRRQKSEKQYSTNCKASDAEHLEFLQLQSSYTLTLLVLFFAQILFQIIKIFVVVVLVLMFNDAAAEKIMDLQFVCNRAVLRCWGGGVGTTAWLHSSVKGVHAEGVEGILPTLIVSLIP